MASVDMSLFKKYDIRGVASGDKATLTPESATLIGRAIATYLSRQHQLTQVVVGRDNRHTSSVLQEAVTRGILQGGMNVIDIGLVSTPLVYWHAIHAGNVGGAMVTGSHLAPHYNGIKLAIGGENIYGDTLQDIAQIIQTGDFSRGKGERTVNQSAYSQYMGDLRGRVPLQKRFSVVVDAGNGTGGIFAKRLLEGWGQMVTGIFLEPNGDYPNHLPNPQEEANLRHLADKVREIGADVGFAFDGDADRVGVVDENGRMIPADRVLALLAQDLLSRHAGAVVVGEVLCSQVLFDAIANAGGKPVMVASGHSIVKDAMRERGALLGGEMSGHIFIGEDYSGVDDAFLVMGRVLQLMANRAQPLSALDNSLPRLYSTPEYRPHCPDADKAHILSEMASALTGKGVISTVDGVRVAFPHGWGIVRASNTEPVLSLRFEATTEAEAHAYRQLFKDLMARYPQVEAWG